MAPTVTLSSQTVGRQHGRGDYISQEELDKIRGQLRRTLRWRGDPRSIRSTTLHRRPRRPLSTKSKSIGTRQILASRWCWGSSFLALEGAIARFAIPCQDLGLRMMRARISAQQSEPCWPLVLMVGVVIGTTPSWCWKNLASVEEGEAHETDACRKEARRTLVWRLMATTVSGRILCRLSFMSSIPPRFSLPVRESPPVVALMFSLLCRSR